MLRWTGKLLSCNSRPHSPVHPLFLLDARFPLHALRVGHFKKMTRPAKRKEHEAASRPNQRTFMAS